MLLKRLSYCFLILLISLSYGWSRPVGPIRLSNFYSDPFFLVDDFPTTIFNTHNSEGCTIAAISSAITVEGRPLLWKNRDVTNHDQEFVYDTTGLYTFVGMTYAGVTDQNWGGVNEVGFAIGNTNAWNFPDPIPGPDDDGYIIKQALQICQTVDDFEWILDSTNVTGRTRPAVYHVMDAFGEMAMFEARARSWVRYDIHDTVAAPHGYMIRANFAYSGSSGSHVGQNRHDRAIQLVESALSENELSVPYMLQTVARDLVTPDVDPYPLPWMGSQENMPNGFVHIHDAICRDITTSMFLIQGVLPGEDPLLSTMWVMAGEPSHNMAVPLWVHAGHVPQVLDGDSTSAICDRVLEMRQITYHPEFDDDILDLWALVDPRGGGLYQSLIPLENSFIQSVADSLSNWRIELPASEVMAYLQDSMANHALETLEAWSPPDSPQHIVGYLLSHSIHLEWTPVTQDRFGRPITVQGYRIYTQDNPFQGREIGQLIAETTNPYFNFNISNNYRNKFFHVTAFTVDTRFANRSYNYLLYQDKTE
jgi:hypothetical protein